MPAMDLIQRDLDVLWHPCSQMKDYLDFPPREVRSASGCSIELAGGHEVLDVISSWWCKSLGHRHPHLVEALRRQSDRFEQIILANTTNEDVVRLSERLVRMANGEPPEHWGSRAVSGRGGGWFGKVFLADNGSTAVEIALKMALQAQHQRGATARTRFASLAGGYHGETVATLSVGDCSLYNRYYGAVMFPCTYLDPVPLRSGPEDERWMDAADEWQVIEERLDRVADELAAIVYEPVLQGAGGMHLYSPDLLRRLRTWADAHDVYLIADEIAAGMGRCGPMLAGHLARGEDGAVVQPDFAVLSKGLTGGSLPLSAVLTTDAVYQQFWDDYFAYRAFLHSNTYTGNALGVAVANAALDVYADDNMPDVVERRGQRMRDGLRALAERRPWLRCVRGCGMMAAVDLTDAEGRPLPKEARTGYRVYHRAIDHGLWLRPLGDTIYLMPPLIMDEELIDRMLWGVERALDEVLG